MLTATVEGKQVKVGDSVCFKCDIEQCGTITAIRQSKFSRDIELVLESKYGFHGDYIGGQTRTTQLASDCWID
jgi:hypothetical protein